jgi:hypothetical protein
VPLIGPYFAACLLLVVAGGAKLARPAPAAKALADVLGPSRRVARSRSLRRSVRALAVIEIATGLIALARPGGVEAALVAVIYMCFAGFVVVARMRGGPLASCGCLGVTDTPATRLHVVLNLGYAVSAAVVAVTVRSTWVPDLLRHQTVLGVPLLLAAALLAVLTALAMTRLPRLQAVRAEFIRAR